jgi:hypothetical protein
MRTDNAVGMFFSQATTWFIIITAATVLHTAHVTTINTAGHWWQRALAARPAGATAQLALHCAVQWRQAPEVFVMNDMKSRASRKIAVLGPIPHDQIVTHTGERLHKYECVMYTAVALSALLDAGDTIVPISHVRRQDEGPIKQILGSFPNIDTGRSAGGLPRTPPQEHARQPEPVRRLHGPADRVPRDLAHPSRFTDHLKPVPHELAVTLGRAFRGPLKPHTIRSPSTPRTCPATDPAPRPASGNSPAAGRTSAIPPKPADAPRPGSGRAPNPPHRQAA